MAEKKKQGRETARPAFAQKPQAEGKFMSRAEAADEMVDRMVQATGAESDVIESVLGAWVDAVRYAALLRAEQDENFLRDLQYDRESLKLRRGLAPEGWSEKKFLNWMANGTGLQHQEIRFLLAQLAEEICKLKSDKAFEPVGWFHKTPRGTFLVRCWHDFLQPIVEEPEELMRGDDILSP